MDTMEDLVIVDEEYLNSYIAFKNLTSQAEEKLKSFCNILKNLRAEGAFLGLTAEAVEDFAVSMESALTDMLSSAGNVQKENMLAYINKINEDDQARF